MNNATLEPCAPAKAKQRKQPVNNKSSKTILEEAIADPLTAPVVEPGEETENLIDQGPPEDNNTKRHAFVVMPYGTKPRPDGKLIDFDKVYNTLIKPVLEEQGFEPFRADEETVSGDIHTDMFQELLLADVVIADLSIHNANVFYELGVRHAFRKRGVIHIKARLEGSSVRLPFDVFNVRTINYHINENGRPDDDLLARNKDNLGQVLQSTWNSNIDAVHSPIYNLLSGLSEPNRSTLTTPLATGFWRNYTDWQERVAIAQRRKYIGDILLLTDEISNPFIKEEAVGEVGRALRELGRHELALNEYRKGLALNPKNRDFRREEARLLNALGRAEAAIVKLERLVSESPEDTVSARFLGAIYTRLWEECWNDTEKDQNQRRQSAFTTFPWLIKAIDTYLSCFHSNLNSHESGIKAYCLGSILVDLADEFDDHFNPSTDITRIRELLPDLGATLRFSLMQSGIAARNDYWDLISLAELLLIDGATELAVTRAYQKAMSYSRRKLNYLIETRERLHFYQSLGFRLNRAGAARQVLEAEITRVKKGDYAHLRVDYPQPEADVQAFVFTGHMLDKPDIKTARLPVEHVPAMQRAIAKKLDELNADDNDHAFLSGAANGGDIIFIEECIKRKMTVHIQMPCDEARYINECVIHDDWIDRYYDIRSNEKVSFHFQSDRVGNPRQGTDPYYRNLRWTLYCSMQMGIDRLRLIALWDGKSDAANDEDGRRVSTMIQQMRNFGGRVVHLNTTKLASPGDLAKPAQAKK